MSLFHHCCSWLSVLLLQLLTVSEEEGIIGGGEAFRVGHIYSKLCSFFHMLLQQDLAHS